MKQVIYLGNGKAREYDGVDEPKFDDGYFQERGICDYSTYKRDMAVYRINIATLQIFDIIGPCDWKEGEVKTEGVDYKIEWFVKTDSYQGEGGGTFKTQKEAEAKYSEWAKYDGQLQSKAYTPKPVIVPIEPKKEGEDEHLSEIELALHEALFNDNSVGTVIEYLRQNWQLTRKQTTMNKEQIQQMAEEKATKVRKTVQSFGYVLTESGADAIELAATKFLVEMYEEGQSQPDNFTAWKVMNDDKVNSILTIIMRVCDDEEKGAILDKLSRRTTEVPGQEWVWIENKITDSGFAVCKYNDDEGRWQPYYDVEKVNLSTLRSELSALQDENKRLREAAGQNQMSRGLSTCTDPNCKWCKGTGVIISKSETTMQVFKHRCYNGTMDGMPFETIKYPESIEYFAVKPSQDTPPSPTK